MTAIISGVLFAVPVLVLAVALVAAAKIYASAPSHRAENRELRQLHRAKRSAIRSARSNIRQGYTVLAAPCWKQVDLIDARIAKVTKKIEESAARDGSGLTQEPSIGRLGSLTSVPAKEHS